MIFDLEVSWKDFKDDYFLQRNYKDGIIKVGQMKRNIDYDTAPDSLVYYELEMLVEKKQRINKIIEFQKDMHKRNLFTDLFTIKTQPTNRITFKIVKNISNSFDETQKVILSAEEMTTEVEVYDTSFFLNIDKSQ